MGDSLAVFNEAINLIKQAKGIEYIKCSKLYETSPVECDSDRPFLNAVIAFYCSLPIRELFELLEEIEFVIGKRPKAKNAPRLIDIDLLFYGSLLYFDKKIIVPHPHWHRRLFVIKPLADITDTIHLSIPINIQEMLSLAAKQSKEQVVTISHEVS